MCLNRSLVKHSSIAGVFGLNVGYVVAEGVAMQIQDLKEMGLVQSWEVVNQCLRPWIQNTPG